MSRLGAVRRVRELVESRRMAELAAAERDAAAAIAARERARERHRQTATATGSMRPAQLAAQRATEVALRDGIDVAERHVDQANLEVTAAHGRRVDAAVQRRSVERIEERRDAAAALAASRRAERLLDDLAIVRWQRS